MAAPIEMSFGLRYMGVHNRQLANTIEPSVCGGDAAFLSNYFDHLLLVSYR